MVEILNTIARVSTHWLSQWHGGYGSIEMVVFFRKLSLIPSCRILEMRSNCGV